MSKRLQAVVMVTVVGAVAIFGVGLASNNPPPEATPPPAPEYTPAPDYVDDSKREPEGYGGQDSSSGKKYQNKKGKVKVL